MIEVNGFKFDISKEGAILRSYTGDELDVVIPDTVDGEPVIKIGNDVFLKSKIKSVIIPETVTHIGSKAFDGCSKLTKIKLPSKIQTISNRCFAMCKSLETMTIPEKTRLIEWDAFSSCSKLKTINWGESLQEIYSGAFAKCNSLTKLELPKGLTDISTSAFLGCKNVIEVHIPSSVSMIKEKAFAKCENLEIVTFAPRPEGMEGWLTTQTGCFAYTIPMEERFLTQGEPPESRVIFGFNKADEEKFRVDQIKMWEHLSGEEKDFFLVDWKSKISGKNRKGKNRLRNLVFLKSTAKEMGLYFKEGFHLELPELEEYLEFSIEKGNTAETALLLDYKNKTYSKDYLEEQETHKELVEIGLKLPTLAELREKWSVQVEQDYIKIIGFKGKNNSEMVPEATDTGLPIRVIGLNDKSTAYNGYTYRKLKKIFLPEGIEEIQASTFRDTSLEEINFPRTLKRIGKEAFLMTELTEVTLFDSLTVLESHTFMQCKKLEKVNLSSTIKEIKERAFSVCVSLVEINLPKQLEQIESQAFNFCINLEEIKLPKNLKKVDEGAFKDCKKLKKVILESDTVEIDPTAFVGCEVLEFVGIEGGENLLPSFQK
ncbi:MAG: leucine-rich repeat domain-containing protein [Eubacteriales bacterium]